MSDGSGCGGAWLACGRPPVRLASLRVEQPHHGRVELDGDRFRYVAEPGYAGADAFVLLGQRTTPNSPVCRVLVNVTVARPGSR
jgi:hypothetical protein